MSYLCPRCKEESLTVAERIKRSCEDPLYSIEHGYRISKASKRIPKFSLKKKKYKIKRQRINFGEASQLKRKKQNLHKHYGRSDFSQEKVCDECSRMDGVMDDAISEGGVYSVCLECGVGIIWMNTSEHAKDARKETKANKSEYVQVIFDSCADHE